MTELDFLRLSKPAKAGYKLLAFFKSIPLRLWGGLKGLFLGLWGIVKKLGLACKDIVDTFRTGDWKTRVSFLVMGFGSFARGQYMRGSLFFLFQTVFNL